ncbi:MAG: YesL family protein [Bacillota bacterium]
MKFAERNPRLWAALEKISSLVLGSLAFWLLLIPVVTAPAALAGLFATVGPLVRGGDDDWLRLFWGGFRRTFGRALLLGLINLAVAALLWLDIRFFWALGHPAAKVAALLLGSVAVLALLVNLYAWPLLVWYPQPLGSLLKRSLLLAAAHPFPAVGGWVGAALILFLLTLLPGQLLALLPLFGPGLVATILSLAAWQVMRRYAGEEDAAPDPAGE